MSPRPYQLGRRRAITEQTRVSILDAIRALLETPEGLARFSVDAVARQANVARMTVYYQFHSKAGLLEALFDDLAGRGGMERLPDAFRRPEPLDALDLYISIFGHFYAAHRLIHRRLRGLSILDPELERALEARNERRRTGLRVLVERIGMQSGHTLADEGGVADTQPPRAWPAVPAGCAGASSILTSTSETCAPDQPRAVPTEEHDHARRDREPGAAAVETVAVLHMLTSFESFDSLAGTTRSIEDVVPLVQRVARAVLQPEPAP